ncbi:MAG: UDP-N-acetylmuramoyl-tripeptide--D-alanyl-D-alanine ligase [Flavobacteriaceae bacterium]|jgi:UDP-N-acetylmuramoyl-tripeptide--D-alanyl-D-alanine ligase|nr:UDP-N-acetylmuramoyl-tripeptide--D-alanyl-D-alanine ligase [Flavobacteriaceae bacterium]MDA7727869.1 UDP-N-acetylmuramoyl-tripeptide--D-alanyl-D-alanine ligase [Flavobacteriaceae bacterium]MDA7848832.1 UDP-N-acetylmuramoyl-tripeptide--D-alanyl-D-alanine ligase [Flavobacteriaceae bacterium]MDB0004117.1 UDP-N-acetylmuramoyl-tripeptide--D-alanyl-D-alanine ligase [Flavobacteriaceae bacterium]MDG1309682.1 UDP-N-acetylmuramoyl-tripeptide--D-alanyl-D-alanine ligase [Flavobacteriaceae bacterium]
MELNQIHHLFLESSGTSTDTRNIKQNSLFFALKGDNFNGNTFAHQALKRGARYAIIDEAVQPTDERFILVTDVLETLQALARFHREQLGLSIIALTGSNGKTTTKELIHAVLKPHFKTVATVGNLNNHIGVPLTLLSMTTDTQIGIVEMGANHAKEIAFLCEIAQPNMGYITNFGKAHLEGFGSEEGVVNAKSELYDYLKAHSGLIILNSDDAKQVSQVGTYDSTYTFSETSETAVNVKLTDTQPFLSVTFKESIIKTNLIGVYNFHNIAAALTIGVYHKLTSLQLKEGIEAYVPANNRSQIIQQNSNEILLDAYNANPSSMEVALENFKGIQNQNKLAILGDMFELGTASAKEHLEVINKGVLAKNCTFYFVGSHFFEQNKAHPNFKFFETFHDLQLHLENITISNTSILIKGSRGMALEQVLKFI